MAEIQSAREKRARSIRRITFTACFTALAVIIKCFTRMAFTIPAVNVQIGIGIIFTFFPAILFGPLYGGVAAALTDFLSAMIAPTGAYIPWLTVTAFCNGALKGLLWKGMKKGLSKTAVAISLAVVLLLGGMGLIFHSALVRDGFTEGWIVEQSALPTRAQMELRGEAGELSRLTRACADLARYNKDSFTLTAVELPDGVTTLHLPEKILVGSTEYTIKIADDAIPAGVTVEKGEEVPVAADAPNTVCATDSLGVRYTFKSSDSYRKNLATYCNLASVGLAAFALAGILFFAVCLSVRCFGKRKGDHRTPYLRILLIILLTGTLTTAVNTYILQIFVSAYAGRSLLILWVPRAITELVAGVFQAYLISLLYGVLFGGRLGNTLKKFL